MTIEIEAGASHCQCSMDSLMQQLFHTCFTDGPESGRLTDYDSLAKCSFVEFFRLSVSQMWAKLQTSERPHPQLPVMHFQEGLES